MNSVQKDHPVVSREEWLKARRALLAEEKGVSARAARAAPSAGGREQAGA